MEQILLAPGDLAPEWELHDEKGVGYTLRTVQAQRPAILTLLRHFGWPFCRQTLARVARLVETSPFPIVGIAIGTGSPTEAAEAGARYGAAVTCLADTDQSIYRAYAVGRAPLHAFAQWSVFRDGVTAFREGHGMGSSHGDVMQMPATFVINQHGVVQYAGYAKTISEFPKESVLRDALVRSS